MIEGTGWTEERKQLRGELERWSSDLADLYAWGVEILQKPLSPARMTLLAHAVRELVNFAAELLHDEGEELAPYENVNEACKELAKTWKDSSVPFPDAMAGDLSDAVAIVPIPRKVFEAAAQVVKLTEVGSVNAQARYAVVATGSAAGDGEASTRMLVGVIRFFKPWFHIRGNSRVPDEDAVARAFQRLESVLRTRTAAFFEIVDDLEVLLKEANTRFSSDEDEKI